MIYVDSPIWYTRAPIVGFWCHMGTDSIDDLEELHQFAEKLGLKRRYFQLKRGVFPHYDLYEGKQIGKGKHTQALRYGARLVPGTDLARTCWLNATGKPYRYDAITHERIREEMKGR